MRKGFTLIELLVVITIVGILSSIATFSISASLKKSRDTNRKYDLVILSKAIEQYKVENGIYPDPGPDLSSNSNEPNWIPGLVPNFLPKLPKDPKQASLISLLASLFRLPQTEVAADVPSKNTTYSMPTLLIAYYPTKDGINIDSSVTGFSDTIANVRNAVQNHANNFIRDVTEASRYHGYKNQSVLPSLQYSILDSKEFFTALPQGAALGGGSYYPDYMSILNNINICHYVDNLGLKTVLLYGYQYGGIVPAESNMAGPYGNISNSARLNNMPICSKTYILYNANETRLGPEVLHGYGHQLEAIFNYIDQPIYSGKFIGPWTTYANDNSANTPYHCGWTHAPPNTSRDYDYASSHFTWSDCEDWTPNASGQSKYYNCSEWQCSEEQFHVWQMQNMPGMNNPNPELSNWWDFMGDFDLANQTHEKLVYDRTPPTVPTGLSASNIWANQLTLSWNASFDNNAVSSYTIKRDGSVLTTTSNTNFTDFSVSANRNYSYTVFATDTSGNSSAESQVLIVSTNDQPSADLERPTLDNTSQAMGGSASTYSFTHSVGNGQSRLLVVGVSIRKNGSTTVRSVTYKGASLSFIGAADQGGMRSEIWALVAPDSGQNQIEVSLSGEPIGSIAGATSWYGAQQSNPTGFSSAYGFSTNPSVSVNSDANSMVVDTLAIPNISTDVVSAGNGQTVYWNRWSSGDTKGSGSGKVGATSVQMSWNTKNEAWALAAVPIKLATGGGAFGGEEPPPAPPGASACPKTEGIYCYVVTADRSKFFLWAGLENSFDSQTWDKVGAQCRNIPPDTNYYNYCVQNQ